MDFFLRRAKVRGKEKWCNPTSKTLILRKQQLNLEMENLNWIKIIGLALGSSAFTALLSKGLDYLSLKNTQNFELIKMTSQSARCEFEKYISHCHDVLTSVSEIQTNISSLQKYFQHGHFLKSTNYLEYLYNIKEISSPSSSIALYIPYEELHNDHTAKSLALVNQTRNDLKYYLDNYCCDQVSDGPQKEELIKLTNSLNDALSSYKSKIGNDVKNMAVLFKEKYL